MYEPAVKETDRMRQKAVDGVVLCEKEFKKWSTAIQQEFQARWIAVECAFNMWFSHTMLINLPSNAIEKCILVNDAQHNTSWNELAIVCVEHKRSG